MGKEKVKSDTKQTETNVFNKVFVMPSTCSGCPVVGAQLARLVSPASALSTKCIGSVQSQASVKYDVVSLTVVGCWI